MMNRFLFSTLILLPFLLLSQQKNVSSLQINEIMKGKEFIGYWPENHFWSVDGEIIYFNWNPKNDLTTSLYSYNITTNKTEKVVNPLEEIIAYDYSQSKYNYQYYTINGNLWRWDKKKKTKQEVFSTNNVISNITRLKNASDVAFKSGNNLFVLCSERGTIKQITHIEKGSSEIKEGETNDQTPLTEQQKSLFLFIQEKNSLEKWNETKDIHQHEKKFYLNDNYLDFLEISKDGKFAFFSVGDYPKNASTQVENHVTEDGYTYSQKARPKVGAKEPLHTFYLSDFENDTVIKLDFSKLPGIRKKPDYYKENGDLNPSYDEDRKIVFHPPISSTSGHTIMDIRSYDNKDRWIVEIDLTNADFNVIDHQHDEAWIGGPGISSWNRSKGELGFWNNGKQAYFQSEKTGYSHLYSYNFQSKSSTQLTKGQYEIHEASLSKDEETFYITANKTHPGNQEFYAFNATKKTWKTIRIESGKHVAKLSPNEKELAILFSSKNTPPELFISENKTDAKLTQITTSTSPEFQSYSWRKPEVIAFLGEDKKKVYARLYSPEKNVKNRAAVIFVHGAGYLQNAHNYWSLYYREYMFHNLLVDNGYTVLDIDFRASAGYGRDHRTAIYRHMGGWDLEDQITGKKLLVDSLGIDENKVGIYGGSYGGFITLMALLNRPQEFACGAALRSVTDWMHYNHEYTSNILNYPDTDSLAYYRSSPINFAEGLEKPLLMLHGMVDDNVQFQDVVRLSQRFIELEKTDWNIAIYPVEAHSFVKPYSWTDEYRRIFELFQEELISE